MLEIIPGIEAALYLAAWATTTWVALALHDWTTNRKDQS